jgi:hypothetical protein
MKSKHVRFLEIGLSGKVQSWEGETVVTEEEAKKFYMSSYRVVVIVHR